MRLKQILTKSNVGVQGDNFYDGPYLLVELCFIFYTIRPFTAVCIRALSIERFLVVDYSISNFYSLLYFYHGKSLFTYRLLTEWKISLPLISALSAPSG